MTSSRRQSRHPLLKSQKHHAPDQCKGLASCAIKAAVRYGLESGVNCFCGTYPAKSHGPLPILCHAVACSQFRTFYSASSSRAIRDNQQNCQQQHYCVEWLQCNWYALALRSCVWHALSIVIFFATQSTLDTTVGHHARCASTLALRLSWISMSS